MSNPLQEQVPEGYKQTEVGIIPKDWGIKSIGEFADVSSGGTPSRENKDYWNGDIPWITTTLVNGEEVDSAEQFITEKGLMNSATKWYNAGTLLMAMYGQGKTRGKVAMLGIDATINQACAGIVVKKLLDSQFLLHYLISTYDDIRNLSNSGGQENLSGRIIKNILVPVPEKEQQTAIANALSDVDALITSLEKLIAKKRDIKTATIQQLLTGKKRLPPFNQMHTGYKQTELGEIPEDWDVLRFSDLGSIYGGLTGKTKYDFGTGDAKYVPFMNVMSSVKVNPERLERVVLKPGEQQNLVLKGDLLFNGSSETPEEVAMCSLVVEEMADLYLNSFCFGFRLNKVVSVDGLFMAYWFRSAIGRKAIAVLAQGATRYNIAKSAFVKLQLWLPTVDEQIAISAMLSDMDNEIDALEQRLNKTQQLKQGMMQELLTGKTRLI